MVDFRYEATDQVGKPFVGRMAAGSLREAIAELQQRGLHIRRVEPLASDSDATEIVEFLPRLSPESATNIAELFGDAIQNQLPLEPALRAAAEEAPRDEARVLSRLADKIAAGTPPEDAFANLGHALPLGLTAIIQAGVQTGNLPKLLSHYVTLSRHSSNIRTSLLMALFYPLLLLFGLIVVTLGVLIFLVPMFANIFDDFGSDLPQITQSLIWVSSIFHDYGLITLAVALTPIFILAITYFLLKRRGRSVSRLPPVDWLTRTAEWGRFCGLLSLLVQARQPLPRALRIVSVSVTSPRVQSLGELLASGIESGLSPWEASHVAGIPGPIRHSLRWADNPEFFIEALDGLAEIYTQQNHRIFRLFPLLFEPILLLGISFVLGYVILAMFLPLIQLLNDLS